ncbi:uncharacterized protein P884DRAFT_316936 [Thermothelomyces heterothallicus CBS 202.75]|uniref:uncharacterized protein n=1 Tax=Thermothelomyces heterothallicus CBS 202.75 TaxID=1149848 RepID=UPI0037437A50
MPPKFEPNTLYLTLNYLRTDGNENRYHWGLFATGNPASGGTLFHATDFDRTNRIWLDHLIYENRTVSDPTTSSTMVVVLKICNLSSTAVQLDHHIREVEPLALRVPPPVSEPQWTCRVWVKYILDQLCGRKVISLSSDTNTIERQALMAANANIVHKGDAKVINKVSDWLSAMDVDSSGAPPRGGSAPSRGGSAAGSVAPRGGNNLKLSRLLFVRAE